MAHGTTARSRRDHSGSESADFSSARDTSYKRASKTGEPTLFADKGYDSQRFRQFVHDHGYQPLIPIRACIPTEQAVNELYGEDTTPQRKRYVVERTLGWLKAFRRLRYRVDRTAASFHAFVYLAVLVLCVRRLMSPTRVGAAAR